VLAEEIQADTDLPPFTNSAVDGFAVRAEDIQNTTKELPITLPIIGDVMAGQVSDKPLAPHTAMRVMTGAPLPNNADAMVMVEDTETLPTNRVAIHLPTRIGQHIRYQGEEVTKGSPVLMAGTYLRPAEIGLLATLGVAEPLVYCLPRVAIISTGDELVGLESGKALERGQIRDSNRYALAAMVEEAGGVVHSLTHIPDTMEATEEAFSACVASGADIIVTAGGVSVGERDFVKPVLEKLGHLEFWRIAMKPGKPLAFGHIGKTLFFGLPGNPISALVTFELFVRPLLGKMAGRSVKDTTRPRLKVRLLEPVPHIAGRQEFVRARIDLLETGEWVARTTGDQGSSRLSSMVGANALLIVPADSTGLAQGDYSEALWLN
jgi:molybdopterin molybdotransferase